MTPLHILEIQQQIRMIWVVLIFILLWLMFISIHLLKRIENNLHNPVTKRGKNNDI